MYASDHNDVLVANGHNDPPNQNKPQWVQGAFYHILYNTNDAFVADPRYALFANYMRTTKVYLCPTDRPTISLGGAYLESKRKLSVGDSIKLEIRSGLRRIHSTAVVRNLGPDGNGIEFVHMLDEDREKLRRLVQRHLRD